MAPLFDRCRTLRVSDSHLWPIAAQWTKLAPETCGTPEQIWTGAVELGRHPAGLPGFVSWLDAFLRRNCCSSSGHWGLCQDRWMLWVDLRSIGYQRDLKGYLGWWMMARPKATVCHGQDGLTTCGAGRPALSRVKAGIAGSGWDSH
jgi:hypothetical protein